MGKDSNRQDIIELWGRAFKRSKNGLDEEQVVSFVNELISQRDTLVQRQQHIELLNQLAERTVAAADDMAKQAKHDAIDQAKTEVDRAEAEAKAMVAKIEEQAQQIVEATSAEVMAIVKQCGELLSQPESLRQQITASASELEPMLSQPEKQASPAPIEEGGNVTLGTVSEAHPEVTDGLPAKAPEQIQTWDQANTSELEKEVPVSPQNQETTDYEGEVELEILPQADKSKMLEIMSHLNGLPEVRTTELIPIAKRSLIDVYLRRPIRLLETLSTLPQVSQVIEVTNGETTDTTEAAHDPGKPRKIQLTLAENSVLYESRERLNAEVSHVLSPGKRNYGN